MVSKRELLDEIHELENQPRSTYQTCEKLANLYTIYDHLYGNLSSTEILVVEMIEAHGDSPFIQAINGKDASKVWPILDELMSCIQVVQPKMYESALRKINLLNP